MMTVESDMLDRLFPNFKDSPNIVLLMELLAEPLQDTADVMSYILAHGSIDTAEGELLDFIGEIIGVERPPLQEPVENLFTLTDEDTDPDDHDNRRGFFSTDDSTGGYLVGIDGLRSVDNPSGKMSDEDYRALIKTKASSYRTKATTENLFLYLLEFGARYEILDTGSYQEVL
jgi:hypothetical protein